MKNIIGGAGITHQWPLNIENVHEVEVDQYDLLFAGDATVVWDLGLPAVGYCWVLAGIDISFDMEPILPGWLFVDSLAGTYIWFTTWVGRAPALLAVASPNGQFMFHFAPCIKFPVDQDVTINWIGTDGAVNGMVSWQAWQELESV